MSKPDTSESHAVSDFTNHRSRDISDLGQDSDLLNLARRFMIETGSFRYTYHFDWLGRPIIQFPQDIVAF